MHTPQNYSTKLKQIISRLAMNNGTQEQQAYAPVRRQVKWLAFMQFKKHKSGRKTVEVWDRKGHHIFASSLFTSLLAACLLHSSIIHLQPTTSHPHNRANSSDIDCCYKHMLHITDLKHVLWQV